MNNLDNHGRRQELFRFTRSAVHPIFCLFVRTCLMTYRTNVRGISSIGLQSDGTMNNTIGD